MSTWSDWSGRPGVFHVRSGLADAQRISTAGDDGQVVVLDPVASKAALLAALAERLGFPAWAGHTWDAAEELLADLSWRDAGDLTVVWPEPELLEQADPAAYRTALDVLAAATRAPGGPVLTVLVVHREP